MTMAPSTSAIPLAPLFDATHVGAAQLAETARAVHIAFVRCPTIQYALCGPYALSLLGFSRTLDGGIDCIVTQGKFGAVKRLSSTRHWWHPSVAAGSMISYYTTNSGIAVQVRWAEAGVLEPCHIVPGANGTMTQGAIGVMLNATQLLRAAIKAYATEGNELDADIVRWIAGKPELDVDARRAMSGLEVEVRAVAHKLPSLLWAVQ